MKQDSRIAFVALDTAVSGQLAFSWPLQPTIIYRLQQDRRQALVRVTRSTHIPTQHLSVTIIVHEVRNTVTSFNFLRD